MGKKKKEMIRSRPEGRFKDVQGHNLRSHPLHTFAEAQKFALDIYDPAFINPQVFCCLGLHRCDHDAAIYQPAIDIQIVNAGVELGPAINS